MSDENGNGADVALSIAGQQLNIKNVKSLNTGVTLVTCLLVALMCYILWNHTEDAKLAQAAFIAAVKDQTGAIKEQTTVQREQNCLMRFASSGAVTQSNADFCKQVTR